MSIQTIENIKNGEIITIDKDKKINVPDNPIILFIEGDGIGPDITKAMLLVVDGAVKKAYKNREIAWTEVYTGEKAFNKKGEWLPQETLDAFKKYLVGIKGPLTTPVGGGIRSLNVTIGQKLSLFACVRPVRYFSGVGSPVKNPEFVNMVVFRENTEDVYAGYEWKSKSNEAKNIIEYLNKNLGCSIAMDSGIGIKPISPKASKDITRKAIKYAIDNNRKVVTLVHKGNIMKFTEGAFKEWGYELAKEEFGNITITEEEVNTQI